MPYEYDEHFPHYDTIKSRIHRFLTYMAFGITIGWLFTNIYEDQRSSGLLGQSIYKVEVAKEKCEKDFNTKCITKIEYLPQ